MSTAPAPTSPRKPPLGLSLRAWLLIAAAVGVGLLLFALLWIDQRDDRNFFRAGDASRDTAGQAFKPLPAPAGSVTGTTPPPAADAPPTSGRIEPSAPPLPTAPPAPIEPLAPQTGPESAPDNAPMAIETPAPRYPAAALRRNESGEVLLRIEVDSSGLPAVVEVVRSSGSRTLDRAAVAAAREWRFRPALRDGQPVPGTVNVPIAFDSR